MNLPFFLGVSMYQEFNFWIPRLENNLILRKFI